MKKIALFAISAVCALTLAGCNKSKGPSEAALKAAENGDYSKLPVAKNPATKKAYDFGGLEVIVYDYWSGDEPSAPVNKAGEDQLAFRTYLEETYNFKCKQIGLVGWADHPAEVANYCITGGDDARIFIIEQRSALPGYSQGLWADVSKVPDIDWT